jgi:hypothetical protein
MKLTRLIIATSIAVIACLIFVVAKGTQKRPPSYLTFTRWRSQAYYSRFADACSALFAANSTRGGSNAVHQSHPTVQSKYIAFTTNETALSGDDPTLPQVLLDVHSSFVILRTNSVTVVFEIYAPYAVKWEPDFVNSNVWKLTTVAEADPIDLFVKTNK